VARILSDDAAFRVVGQATDARSAVEMTERERPDVVLLDMSMPEGGGLGALARIAALDPAPRVAMLTVSEEDDDVMQALKGGAIGYILKGIGGRELVAIVKELAQGRSYVSPSLAARILSAMREGGGTRRSHPVDDLSKREEDILRLVAEGRSNKEVGRQLNIQEKTVKHYMTAILQKLHVRNRTEAAVMARDRWKD
jgi:two-component system nitrate/nitrite response regulator NarL